jgi:hypothetical protein
MDHAPSDNLLIVLAILKESQRRNAYMRFPCPKSTSFKRRKSASKPWAQDRENREDAFIDLKFLAGDQWPNAIRQQREARNRPRLTINGCRNL